MARRMLRFGGELLRTTFPACVDLFDDDKKKKKAGADGKGGPSDAPKTAADERAEASKVAQQEVAPALESEWDYGAAVSFEIGDLGSNAPDVCFVCGGAPHLCGRQEESDFLNLSLIHI